ncbi:hypothetical protein NPX13_g3351 [Xylaria arbuscula]|uniref:Uncharacterized protein n=1 Tax=Xylaria arbuscula TaxID=114810 RepID=A0A9W8NIE4_9PEZI|nr:hypothetical protein NPX13_g3351 [Xylaria arbuscula]
MGRPHTEELYHWGTGPEWPIQLIACMVAVKLKISANMRSKSLVFTEDAIRVPHMRPPYVDSSPYRTDLHALTVEYAWPVPGFGDQRA